MKTTSTTTTLAIATTMTMTTNKQSCVWRLEIAVAANKTLGLGYVRGSRMAKYPDAVPPGGLWTDQARLDLFTFEFLNKLLKFAHSANYVWPVAAAKG